MSPWGQPWQGLPHSTQESVPFISHPGNHPSGVQARQYVERSAVSPFPFAPVARPYRPAYGPSFLPGEITDPGAQPFLPEPAVGAPIFCSPPCLPRNRSAPSLHDECRSGFDAPFVASNHPGGATSARDFSHSSSSSSSSVSDIAGQQPVPAFIHPCLMIPMIEVMTDALQDPNTWRIIRIASRSPRSRRHQSRSRRDPSRHSSETCSERRRSVSPRRGSTQTGEPSGSTAEDLRELVPEDCRESTDTREDMVTTNHVGDSTGVSPGE